LPFTAQSSPAKARQKRMQSRYASADFTATEDDDDEDEIEQEDQETERGGEREDDGEDDEDEDGVEDTPLLPIFSEAHLGNSYGMPPQSIANVLQTLFPSTTSLTPYD
jgi:hypothetical protein